MSAAEVFGCRIGSENVMYVADAEGDLSGAGKVYWYEVEKGGILTCTEDIYRYGPEAEISEQAAGPVPPAWVTIYTKPDAKELFRAEDAEKLSAQYGIDLYFVF